MKLSQTNCEITLVVSFSQGLIYDTNKFKNSFSLAFTMGFFQWLMPFIGYFATCALISYIEPYSKLVVFLVFTILGIKFILESFNKQEEKIRIDLKCLILFGIATSIDALASGVSIKLSDTPLFYSTLIIGIASFLFSLLGFWSAKIFKKLPSQVLQIFGGFILIFLAIKALF